MGNKVVKTASAEKKRNQSPEHYYVYVVLLSDDVLNQPKFRKANPDCDVQKPCLYVGMTGLDPDTRFDNHKAGHKANKYVQEFGLELMMGHVDDLTQPMSYEDAKYLEVDVAIRLRNQGYAVWQA